MGQGAHHGGLPQQHRDGRRHLWRESSLPPQLRQGLRRCDQARGSLDCRLASSPAGARLQAPVGAHAQSRRQGGRPHGQDRDHALGQALTTGPRGRKKVVAARTTGTVVKKRSPHGSSSGVFSFFDQMRL